MHSVHNLGSSSAGAGFGISVAPSDLSSLLDICRLLPRVGRLQGVTDKLLPSAHRILYAPTPRSDAGSSTSPRQLGEKTKLAYCGGTARTEDRMRSQDSRGWPQFRLYQSHQNPTGSILFATIVAIAMRVCYSHSSLTLPPTFHFPHTLALIGSLWGPDIV